MAKKKDAKEAIDDEFSFFDKVKTLDKYVDAGYEMEDYGTIDSGSYALNAALSGDIFGGFNLNKLVMAAGLKGSGKSFIGKFHYAKQLIDKGYFIYYYDSENECTEKDLINKFGFIPHHFKLIPINTIEFLTESVMGLITQFEEDKGASYKNKRKVAIVIDSQGMLTTEKTKKDVEKGSNKQDMTGAKLLKRFYKLVTVRLGRLGIPAYITNHMYKDPSIMYGDPTSIAGGEGALYACSTIFKLTKTYGKKDENSGEVPYVVLNALVVKSRTCKEKWGVPILLDYKTGLNRYYGLQRFAQDAGLICEYSAKEYPELPQPVVNGRKFAGKSWVIMDPKIPEGERKVCPEKDLYRGDAIGTILNEINAYVIENYKLHSPSEFNYKSSDDIELAFTDDDVSKAETEIEQKNEADATPRNDD